MEEHQFVATNLLTKATGSIVTYEGHNGSSTIDYVLVPSYLANRVISCHTGNNMALNTSDHLSIEVVMHLQLLPREVQIGEKTQRIRWDKADLNGEGNEYQTIVWEKHRPVELLLRNDSEFTPETIDHILDEVVRAIHDSAKIIPRSKYVRHLKPYWCEELNNLKREKMHWYKRWRDEGRTKDENDHARTQMKISKKRFCKRLRQLSHEYHNRMVAEATQKAEINRIDFWRFMRSLKGKRKGTFNAIKDKNDRVLYELNEVLEEWRGHFDNLSTPKNDARFNDANFQRVTTNVREWSQGNEKSEFLEIPFTEREIEVAVLKLNNGKTPGHDDITSEHVKYAGRSLVTVLCLVLNACVQIEYIPRNFSRGVQVPLYKGKNTCPLNMDNYRGITLLSTFNKLFEALVWERIQHWWFANHVTSVLQGAARKGFSCVHSALTLQETIAKQREDGKKVFVAYYDVSKAFDSVWTDGLFFQLHNLGIKGNLWRLLYKSYNDFKCCVRIGAKDSSYYTMECGIHQGGYLSLVKYTVYIDSLIVSLERSNLCCGIYRVKSSPVGYADDMAACTTSKRKMDLVMEKVHQHGCDWRYSFNAGKSAVLIFGESSKDRKVRSENRMFNLEGKGASLLRSRGDQDVCER